MANIQLVFCGQIRNHAHGMAHMDRLYNVAAYANTDRPLSPAAMPGLRSPKHVGAIDDDGFAIS